jgi:hypothetical protein
MYIYVYIYNSGTRHGPTSSRPPPSPRSDHTPSQSQIYHNIHACKGRPAGHEQSPAAGIPSTDIVSSTPECSVKSAGAIELSGRVQARLFFICSADSLCPCVCLVCVGCAGPDVPQGLVQLRAAGLLWRGRRHRQGHQGTHTKTHTSTASLQS